jgi:hypothetical protein
MARATAAKTPKCKKAPTPKQLKDRDRNRAYYEQNREQALKRMRARHRALSPAERTVRNWRIRAKPAMPAPGTARARDYRNIALAQAYCEWSDIEEVVRIYTAAAIMTELTGEQYVVDHTVPLINPFVCGLHTHTNMQVITERENQLKGNMLWPGMSPISWESLELLKNLC